MTNKKLGKHPKKFDRRNLLFSRYFYELPTPPTAIDHASNLPVNIGMMGNDKYGDCTVAAAGHMVQSWTTYAQRGMLTIPDADILSAYRTVSPNDDGAYLLDVLNLWRKTGIGGEKIEAFVEVAGGDLVQAKLAIQYFGSTYIGMALPSVNTFGPWDVPNPTWAPNPYNGHAVCLIAYDDTKQMFKVATWGEIWNMSYGWFRKYVDEGYAVLDDISTIVATGKTPEGFDMTALQDDLLHIGDVPTPPVPVPPPVPPTPVPVVPSTVVVTGTKEARWVVTLDGIAQGNHIQPFEAGVHASNLILANPTKKVKVYFPGSYLFTVK